MKTKRLTILILFFVCSLSKSFAQNSQEHDGGSLALKPNVGLAISNLSGADLKSKTGFSAGLDLLYTLSHSVNLKSGMEYTVIGAKDGYSKLSLGYIDIPLLADVKIYKGLYAGAGVMCNINVHDGRTDFLLLSKTNRWGLSVPVELGCQYRKFVINVSYTHGITNAYKDFRYKNRSVQFTLGYKIHI